MFSPMPNISVEPPVTSLNSPPYTSDGLPFAEVFMITFNQSSKGLDTKAHFKAFHCNLDFGMQVYTGFVKDGMFIEIPGEFVQGNWTFESNNETTPDVNNTWYWSLKTNISGTEHQVKINYAVWAGIA